MFFSPLRGEGVKDLETKFSAKGPLSHFDVLRFSFREVFMHRLCLGLSVFIALMLVSLSWTHFGISQNLIKSAKRQIIQPQASGDVHIQALL